MPAWLEAEDGGDADEVDGLVLVQEQQRHRIVYAGIGIENDLVGGHGDFLVQAMPACSAKAGVRKGWLPRSPAPHLERHLPPCGGGWEGG